MDVKGRRDEYAEITRAAIVDAAIDRFSANGFARTSIDAVADAARVTKGGVYHHFKDKADLFEAAFAAMEERLLARVTEAAVNAGDDPWRLMEAGIDAFLAECCEADFRRIALQEAPAALGWDRWKRVEERYFLGVVVAGLEGLSGAGLIDILSAELPARMFLAAATEAGLAIASAENPEAEQRRAARLLMRLLRGLQ
jgi:AcrR family transcriptional regulator